MRHLEILKEADQDWWLSLAQDIWNYIENLSNEEKDFLKKGMKGNQTSFQSFLFRFYISFKYNMAWDTPFDLAHSMAQNDYPEDVVAYKEIRKYLDQRNNVDEGDVITGEFEKRLRQKRGMMYNPDAEPPVSRLDGEKFERFEVEEHGKNSATIYGVRADGGQESVGTTQRDAAHTLAGAYNAGGYSDQPIEKVPLGKTHTDEI